MTTPLTPSVLLNENPVPDRRRWQPLRAGILGLFRYDKQVFRFHRGRMLLRGNNGSGKSMALEVLLPFVLDADLAPQRLSTFGSRERGMYLWLLGYDDNDLRASARGYVWVEFGRQTEAGPEYFTAGAGLETTRTKRVHPWFFTTSARVDVDFSLGDVGEESMAQLTLRARLSDFAANGLDGRVHHDADSHRTEVDRVLFGLDEHQFAALRGSLLRLRKPKLSDKLSERALADVLRESLPPINADITDDLAEGFDKLDQYRANVDSLSSAADAMRQLHRSYRTYARKVTVLRAATVADAAAATRDAIEALNHARESLTEAKGSLETIERDLDRRSARLKKFGLQIETLEQSAAYTEGKDLDPLRRTAEDLERAAAGMRDSADAARKARDQRRVAAGRAKATTDESRTDLAARAARARGSGTALASLDLFTDCAELVDRITSAEPSADRMESVLDAVRQRVAEDAKQLSHLARLIDRSKVAAARASEADRAARTAAEELTNAERALADAQERYRSARQTYLSEVRSWIERCAELVAGAAPPETWPDTEPETAVTDWTERAAFARRSWLATGRRQISDLTFPVADAGEGVRAVSAALDRLDEWLGRVWTDAYLLRDAQVQFANSVRSWSTGLVELCRDTPTPALLRSPDPRVLDSRIVAQWVTRAAARRQRDLGRYRERVRATLTTVDGELEEARLERRRLDAGGLPDVDVPPTRLSPRDGRAGAPFYRLVDFSDQGAGDDRRKAMLEAALVGSGLADAWVCPDGRLLTGPEGKPLRDLQVVTEGPVAASPLSRGLRPDPVARNSSVTASVVSDLLDRVELVDTALDVQGPGLTIGWDGTWSSGVLRGAYELDRAGLIGAASREERRRARLDELATIITRLTADRERLVRVGADIDAAEEQLAVEQRFPDDGAVRDAARALTERVNDVRTRAEELPELARDAASALTSVTARVGTVLDGTGCADLIPLAPAELMAELDERLNMSAAAMDHATKVGTLVWSLDGKTGGGALITPPRSALEQITAHVGALSTALREAVVRTDQRERILEEEIAGRPGSDELRRAESVVTDARVSRGQALALVEDKRAAQANADRDHQDAGSDLDTALALAGLAGQRERVSHFRDAVAGFSPVVEDWVHAAAGAIAAEARARDMAGEVNDAETAFAKADTAAKDAAAKADEALERYRLLEERMGKPYQETVRELERLTTFRKRFASAIDADHLRQIESAKAVTAAEERLKTTQAKLDDAARLVCGAGNSFLRLHRLGVLDAAVPDTEPEEVPQSELKANDDIGLETVVTWARVVLAALSGERVTASSAGTAVDRVETTRHSVEPALAGEVRIRQYHEDGVLIMTASRTGEDIPLMAVAEALDQELTGLRSLLEQKEAELFEKFLSDEVRSEVGRRIFNATSQVDLINKLMIGHPTNSGLRFKLGWHPNDGSGMPAEIIELLSKPMSLHLPSERDRLASYFQGQIAELRAGDSTMPWREQLAELLDYRRWYAFELYCKRPTDTAWSRLNSRRHGQMSGGEKAVALHMPLFAAAATHCEASQIRVAADDGSQGQVPGCPRLILLDEVFAGVDQENRGALFDLIRVLDLDLVATSESEMGLYPELDGMAIYQLVVDNAIPGLLAVRSVWDGREEHRMLDHDLAELE